MALAGDIGVVVSRHWIRGSPWENPQKYFDRSPIRVVGNVITPTLVMVGEEGSGARRPGRRNSGTRR